MKTAVVYVVISNDQDIYLEQVWASAFSLKMHTPSANVTILTDSDTEKNILSTDRCQILSVVDNIIPVHFDDNYTNMERSRWIKTNMRSLLKGDFLFIDSDTIIADDISDIDLLDCSIGAVLDLHCHFDKFPFRDGVTKRMKKIFDEKLKPETQYFNSGVLLVKDNDEARQFFNRWHENWKYTQKKNYARDQLSLVKTCNDYGNIAEIDGSYNCQILGSIEYLHGVKIIHFFNTKWGQPSFSPFFGTEIYSQIKRARAITPAIETRIRNCKQSFFSPSATICQEDFYVWKSNIFAFLRWLYMRHKLTFLVVQKFFNLVERFFNIRERTVSLRETKPVGGGGRLLTINLHTSCAPEERRAA